MNAKSFNLPGLEAFDQTNDANGYPYIIFRNLKEKFVTCLKYSPFGFPDDNYWNGILEKLKTLLYNRVKFEEKEYQTEEELNEFIERHYQKFTPQEKFKLVIEYLASRTSFDGEVFEIRLDELEASQTWRKFYFKNLKEFTFYIDSLREQNLIVHNGRTFASYMGVQFTLHGLTILQEIGQQKNSRYCFVAMSFDKAMEYAFADAIQPALTQTGFLPFIVSSRHIDSDKTINDEIIAGIKKSRFTIADFTQHKSGVYFEAGYALGRGQKVIYTCRKEDIEKAHFDTRNFQHIVWENAEDLKKKLIDKINAFIIE